MQWIYVLCILAAGAIAKDSFERVKRAPGKRCPRIQNFPGKVKYKRRGTRAQFRCYKTFSRYGPRFVSCRSDNTWSGEPPLCIKAGCVPIDIQHHIKLDMTESYGGALLSFKCEDEYQLIGSTEISCDSKVWSATPPVCKAPIQLTECDFEIDLCGWTQDDSDELDWIRTQGQTSTGGTGPKADHTFQSLSGHYMFVESSNPARNGDQARLLSPMYPADMGDMCFEFWYHILGPDDPGHVGTLEVYVRGDSEFIEDLQPLFVKGGNQGDVWKRGDIYIDKRDEPYQIVIVTTRKLSYISDIAIDDVKLYNCSGITTSTTTTTTPTTTPSSTATSTISSTVTSATLSTSQPTGLPRSATTSTSAKVTSSAGTSSTGTTSLLTTTPIISPSSTVSASTPSKSSPKETTTVPVPSVSGNLTSAVSATTTNKITTTISVPLETTTVRKSSSTRTTQLPVRSSTATNSTSTLAPSQSTSTPKPSTTSTPTTSTVQTVKSTTFRVPSSTTTTERLTSTSTVKTSTTSSGVQTETSSTTSKLPTTNSSKVSSTTARTTPASTETSTRETTSLSTAGTTLKSTLVSLSTHTKLKTTSSTTVKSSSETPTITVTSTTTNTQKSSTTEAILNKTVSPKISTTSVKVNKTVSTESKVTTVESNDTEPVVVAQPRSQHPADETLRPLMIGLGVGIVAGLIIIGVVAWVCVRRRKFYTSRYEDELKPITKSSSNENFNNIQYEYHDDEEYQ